MTGWSEMGMKMRYTTHDEERAKAVLLNDTASSGLKLAWVRPEEMEEGVEPMEVVHERCCGLDVHKKTVVACILITPPTGRVQKHLRVFSTMTADLLALGDWLSSHQITHVAMESTGVYWKPVFNLLESMCQVILINAQHMKAVSGRKVRREVA